MGLTTLSEDLACLEICFSIEQQQPTDQRTITYFVSAVASPCTVVHVAAIVIHNIAIIIILCK